MEGASEESKYLIAARLSIVRLQVFAQSREDGEVGVSLQEVQGAKVIFVHIGQCHVQGVGVLEVVGVLFAHSFSEFLLVHCLLAGVRGGVSGKAFRVV